MSFKPFAPDYPILKGKNRKKKLNEIFLYETVRIDQII